MESLNVSVTREEVKRFLSVKSTNNYCCCLGSDSGDGFGIGCCNGSGYRDGYGYGNGWYSGSGDGHSNGSGEWQWV